MTLLTYTLLTDPAPLEASAAGRSPSTGTVYLVVTNTGQVSVSWRTFRVQVPVGDGAGHLTPNITTVTAQGRYTTSSGTKPVDVQRQDPDAFLVTAPAGASFAPGDHLVLTLENITVAATAGLAVLGVKEHAKRGNLRLDDRSAALAVVKTAPKEIPAPRDFRADDAMVAAGANITLRWEGSDDFDYKILFPDGQATNLSGGSWSPAADDAPKRATTYTLVATSRTTPKREHVLTTTVQVRNPVLESLTAKVAVITPLVVGPNSGEGGIAFLQGGVTVRRTGDSQNRGALFADMASLNGVKTGAVYTEFIYAKDTSEHRYSWINLHGDGITAYLTDGGSNGLGSVTASRFNT
ncbi:hypothetical protein ABZU32_33150 [Sphaerisporangium sp. NPDC005288]|uniref:hypothetical protein n=1 Tax=Sphaerisporangium sp. NPDC005288 TaxID=3155114 RepID=UPI0033B0C476